MTKRTLFFFCIFLVLLSAGAAAAVETSETLSVQGCWT